MQSTLPTRRDTLLVLAGSVATALGAPAFAQADEAIRFILPNATGSGGDAITRTAQPALAEALGHPIVIDNQPGAGRHRRPAGAGPRRPTARPSAWCRTTSSSFRASTRRCRSTCRTVADLIGGQVDFGTAATPSVQAHIPSGALRAIGVATSQRVPAAPAIATFVEQGLPNDVVEAWFAVIGPKGMPATEVQRTHAAVVAAFADPTVKEAMVGQGNLVKVEPADHATPFFRSEMTEYAALVKKAGVELQ